MLQNFIAQLRPFVYNKNITDPRGTPQFIAARPDSYRFIDTY